MQAKETLRYKGRNRWLGSSKKMCLRVKREKLELIRRMLGILRHCWINLLKSKLSRIIISDISKY
jgi:hypothetical protein